MPNEESSRQRRNLADLLLGTPLRKATTGGLASGALLYAITSLTPEYKQHFSQLQNPTGMKLAVSATAATVGFTVSLLTDYLHRAASRMYNSYRN